MNHPIQYTLRPATGMSILALAGLAGCTGSVKVMTLKSQDIRLGRLAWMTGAWVCDENGTRTEEHWTQPHAGTMFGVSRTSTGDRTTFFEFLRIEYTDQGAVYTAQPKGRPGTPFHEIDAGRTRVVFENTEHDFPQEITYWLDDDGRLHARIDGVQNGQRASRQWDYVPARVPTWYGSSSYPSDRKPDRGEEFEEEEMD